MIARLYPSIEQVECILEDKYGKSTFKNYQIFEGFLISTSLRDFQAMFNTQETDKRSLMFKLRSDFEVYHQMKMFEMKGWGEIEYKAFKIITNAGLNIISGNTKNPRIIQELIEAQKIQTGVILTELCWQ